MADLLIVPAAEVAAGVPVPTRGEGVQVWWTGVGVEASPGDGVAPPTGEELEKGGEGEGSTVVDPNDGEREKNAGLGEP